MRIQGLLPVGKLCSKGLLIPTTGIPNEGFISIAEGTAASQIYILPAVTC